VTRGASNPRGRRAALWNLAALWSLALLSIASLTSCLAPTLPLPPPNRPNISAPDADGNIRITGVAQSRAQVFALNVRTDLIVGQQTGASGAYDFKMPAMIGDEIAVWHSVGKFDSEPVTVVVPAKTITNGIPPLPENMGGAEGD
jgi:hypothetical protein